MRKLARSLENPIDDVIINMANNSDSIYRYFGVGPNFITSLSLFFGILTAYLISIGNTRIAALTYIISYYYDCMDGNYARKYNMVTEFGGYYDHFSDMFKICIIFMALYYLKPEKFWKILPIIIIFFILSNIHLGCQEKVADLKYDQFLLDDLRILCPDPSMIKYTRWFGVGTVTLVIAGFIFTY